METLEVIPDPISLIESMRAVGYSVEAAIADLIDNSISAQADAVEIKYDATDDPFVAILDNGRGMAPDELTNAMRHGSGNPTDAREPDDLGRFGLGLKTASLSQCRKLTVVSRKDSVTSARRWDLDVVQRSGRWLVVVPDFKELEVLPMFSRLQAQNSGKLASLTEIASNLLEITGLGVDQAMNIDVMPNGLPALPSQKSALAGRRCGCIKRMARRYARDISCCVHDHNTF